MSAALRRKVIVSLASLVRIAEKQGYVNRNAVTAYKVKTSGRAKRKLRIGVDIPTIEELQRFGDVIDNLGDLLFFLAAAYTGLRASELRGLTWASVDLDGRFIHVTQRADTYNKIGHPKSESAHRSVPIPAGFARALRKWRQECPKGALDLVFPNTAGNVQSLTNIRKRKLIPLMEKAGVVDEHGGAKYTRLHCFRHFFASWCGARETEGGAGLTLQRTQQLMGHATLSLTADRYSHLFPSDDVAAQMDAAAPQIFDATQTQHAPRKLIAA